MTQADDALGRPGAEASPLPSQTLCLSAINTNRSRLSLQDPVDFLEKAQKRQPPELPQVTGDTPAFKASEKEGEQLQKKLMDDLNANSHVPEGPEPLAQEIARRKQRRGGQGAGERKAEPWRTRTERALKATASRFASRTGNLPKTSPWPDLLGAHLGHVPGEVERKKEAGDAQRWSEADPKGVAEDADFNGSLRSAEAKSREIARQLWEEKRTKEELTRQIISLQAEEASLRQGNSQLESEIQQLKLKLQILPKLYPENLRRLQRKLSEEETRCFEIEKKLCTARRNMKSVSQIRNLYKTMAEDMGRELEGNTSYCRKGTLFREKIVQESWKAVVLTQRHLQALRKENDHSRHLLANAESNFQPFPSGPWAPAAPPGAPRGPAVSPGDPLHRQHP